MSSNHQVHRHKKQHTHATAAPEVTTFFAQLANASASPHPRLRAVTGSSQFNIEGAGSWRVAIKDGLVIVGEASEAGETGGTTAPVDAVVTTTAEDMARVLRGEDYLNAFCATLQEIMTVRGDPAFTTTLLEVLCCGPSATQTR
jgi:hypothetical protein